MNLEDIRLLYDYDSWANRRMLEACGALDHEQFLRKLGSSFSSVRDTLAHILGGEWLWLERWHERMPTQLPSPEDYPDLASLRGRWAEVQRDLDEFVASLKAEDLDRVYTVRTTSGGIFTHPLRQMLQHLANHSTYHRGQVTTLLRQLGAKPVGTDLITFYRERASRQAAGS